MQPERFPAALWALSTPLCAKGLTSSPCGWPIWDLPPLLRCCAPCESGSSIPCFGYFEYPQEYYDRIAWWHERRNGVVGLKPENIGYENGVLGGVANALAVVCSRGDKVLVHAPTYTGFTNTLKNAGYDLVTSWLQRDAEGVWRMDYEDMERKLATREVHAAILCSPHNPTGRVWERWELERAMGLFRKYDVYVISDEIWSDIVLGGSVHIPTRA